MRHMSMSGITAEGYQADLYQRLIRRFLPSREPARSMLQNLPKVGGTRKLGD